jgi:integrase
MVGDVAWFIADYADGAGTRHQRRFPTQKEARAFHDQVKVDIRAGKYVSLSDKLTIADVAKGWIKSTVAAGRERTTIRQYQQHVDLHIVPRIGATRLSKMTPNHCRGFRDSLLSGEQKLSPAMARKVWVSFKGVLASAHCKHLADGLKMSSGNRDVVTAVDPKDIPTLEEFRRLIQWAPSLKAKTIIKVAAMTGLRASELRGLRWSDVDLKAGKLEVNQRADRWNVLGSPKTKKSRRTVEFGSDLRKTLTEWKLACPKGELDLVFPTKTGAVIGYRNFDRYFDAASVAAHVVTKKGKPKYSPHTFRHFFASWCINPKDRGGRGLTAKEVQEWMGHSTIAMTMDIYSRLFRKPDHKEIDEAERNLFAT